MIEVTYEMRRLVHDLNEIYGDSVGYVIKRIIELHEERKPIRKSEPVGYTSKKELTLLSRVIGHLFGLIMRKMDVRYRFTPPHQHESR